MAKIVGYRHPALSGVVKDTVFGKHIVLQPKTVADHLSMMTALVAIGYVGYVTVKDWRIKRGRRN